MTRINVGVRPSELSKKHLQAEHREIKRIPNCIAKGRYSMKDQPKEFTLGTGHVKFFYDKLLYLKNRYEELYAECINKKIDVQYYGNAWDNVPQHLMNDYTPTPRDREIILERINERLRDSEKRKERKK
jgi:deoxyribonuclease (pyrimidine dimer)